MPPTPEKKSPILKKPLRAPGHSLDRQLTRMFEDGFTEWALLIAIAVALTALEWYRYFFNVQPSPVIVTVICTGLIPFSFWRIRKLKEATRSFKLGLDGERVVGQYLDRLQADGYKIIHDVPGDEKDTWNIDHVVIGPTGVYAIETKTRSKTKGKQQSIFYDGHYVTIDGGKPDRDFVTQTEASARRIKQILEDETGRDGRISVQPVLLFPGWFIEPNSTKSPLWVLEPKALPKWLANREQVVTHEDIVLYTNRLADYVRRIDDREIP